MSGGSAIDWAALAAAAHDARSHAYAPYSGFTVGAALLAEDGRVFVGTNVENASYPLSGCAERSAISAAIASGARRFVAIAVASPGAAPASPCGGCRQVLAEFPPSFPIRCYGESGEPLVMDVAGALPGAFDPNTLAQGQRAASEKKP